MGALVKTFKASTKIFSQAALDGMVIEAVAAQDERLLGLALMAGGSANARHPDAGVPVIQHAAAQGNWRTIGLLADFGADLNAPDKEGNTALHATAIREQHSAMRDLLRRKANVNAQNNKQMTILMYAVLHADTESVQDILKANPNTRVRNANGQTALEIAKKGFARHNEYTPSARAALGAIITMIEAYDTKNIPDHSRRPPRP